MKFHRFFTMMALLSLCDAFATRKIARFVTSQKKPIPSHRQVTSTFHRNNVIRQSIFSRAILEYSNSVFAFSTASLGSFWLLNIFTGFRPLKGVTIIAALGFIGPLLLFGGELIRYSLDTPDSSLGMLMLQFTFLAIVGVAVITQLANSA